MRAGSFTRNLHVLEKGPKARFSSPNLARFLQPDSIVPGAANPQNLNRYAYVLNSPVNFTDPTGHFCESGQVTDTGYCVTSNTTPSQTVGAHNYQSPTTSTCDNPANTHLPACMKDPGQLGGDPKDRGAEEDLSFCEKKPWHTNCEGGVPKDPTTFWWVETAMDSPDPIVFCYWKFDTDDNGGVSIYETNACMRGLYVSAGLPLRWYGTVYPYQNPLAEVYDFTSIENQLIMTASDIQNLGFIEALGMDPRYYPNYEAALLSSLIAHYPLEYAAAAQSGSTLADEWWDQYFSNARGGGE